MDLRSLLLIDGSFFTFTQPARDDRDSAHPRVAPRGWGVLPTGVLCRLELRANGFDVGLEEAFAVDLAVVEGCCSAGGDECDLGDAEEAEDGAKIGLDEVERGHDRGRIVDAARGDEESG